MIRAYMVHKIVGGFSHQAVNALHPTAEVCRGAQPWWYYPADAGNGGDDDGDGDGDGDGN